MKTLSEYSEQGISNLLNQYGAFFAFSDQQFEEKKKPDTKYVNCGAGLICPKPHTNALIDGLEKNNKTAVAQDIAENGKEAIIIRELHNHEAFYTWEIDDTVDALSAYGFTPEEIQSVFEKEAQKVN